MLVDTTGKLRLKNENGPIKGLTSLIYGQNKGLFEIEDQKVEINEKIDLGYLIVQRSQLIITYKIVVTNIDMLRQSAIKS